LRYDQIVLRLWFECLSRVQFQLLAAPRFGVEAGALDQGSLQLWSGTGVGNGDQGFRTLAEGWFTQVCDTMLGDNELDALRGGSHWRRSDSWLRTRRRATQEFRSKWPT